VVAEEVVAAVVAPFQNPAPCFFWVRHCQPLLDFGDGFFQSPAKVLLLEERPNANWHWAFAFQTPNASWGTIGASLKIRGETFKRERL